MISPSYDLENILAKHLQKTISIRVNSDEIKKGKFILFQNNILLNGFHYELTIERTNKIDIFKIPYPFGVEHYIEDGLLYLDYRYTTLSHAPEHRSKLEHLTGKYADVKTSKFLDKIIEIEFK